MNTIGFVLAALISSLWLPGLQVHAGGIVTALDESNLRAALSGGGTVTFAVDGTIPLTNTLVITNETTIDGTGHAVTLRRNTAVRVLMVNPQVKLVLRRLTIHSGVIFPTGSGGGVFSQGELTAADCTFWNNHATFGAGGGIYQEGGQALRLSGCTFANNGAKNGGAIYVNGGALTVTNCTFFANFDGAVQTTNLQPSWLVNCTFAQNPSSFDAGGLQHWGAGSPTLINSILSSNSSTYSTVNAAGVVDGGYNLITDDSLTNSTTLRTTKALLAPLADNGGPTLTMALLPGSPALDRADPSAAPKTDQRGVVRPKGPAPDIGAFEGVVAPDVQFTSVTYFVLEGEARANLQVMRTGSSDEYSTVMFSVSAGTATSGADFFSTNLTVSFAPGEMSSAVYVTITNDSQIELDETILLSLSNPSGATLGPRSNATVTILDDDNQLPCGEPALRAAISKSVRVAFDCDGTINLSSPIPITGHTILDANGHNVILSGNNATRLFNVAPGGSLTLIGLTLTQGKQTGNPAGNIGVVGEPAYGGAIFADHAELTVIDCRILKNLAVGGAGGMGVRGTAATSGGTAGGGAIYVNDGILNATNTEFADNLASGGGAGAPSGEYPYEPPGGSGIGGAIHCQSSLVNLGGCLFRSNQGQGGAEAWNGLSGSQPGPGFGGALFSSQGTSVVANCTFMANRTICTNGTHASRGGDMMGGAIYITNASALISTSQFISNSAVGSAAAFFGTGVGGLGRGGAIGNWGTMDIANCSFSNNVAAGGGGKYQGGDGEGGAVFNASQVRFRETRLAQNSTQGAASISTRGVGRGGAIFNTSTSIISSSLLVENTAQGALGGNSGPSSEGLGGAIFNTGVTCLTNATLAANLAKGAAGYSFPPYSTGANAYGGGICSIGGQVFLIHCTLASNNAAGGPGTSTTSTNGFGFGGGMFTTNSLVTLLNTILAGNVGGTNSLLPSNSSGPLLDLGHNLSSDTSAAFTNVGSLNNTDPHLGPLADNGGSTLTMALLPGSPAIDAGVVVSSVDSDQRGFQRPFGSAPDIGAFEFGAVLPVTGFKLAAPTQITGIWQLSLSGPAGSVVRLQESTNLATWKDIATNAISGEGFLLLPLPLSAAGQRFYRTVSP